MGADWRLGEERRRRGGTGESGLIDVGEFFYIYFLARFA